MLIYEAMRDFLPVMEGVIDTPMGQADVTFVDPTRPIKVWESVNECGDWKVSLTHRWGKPMSRSWTRHGPSRCGKV